MKEHKRAGPHDGVRAVIMAVTLVASPVKAQSWATSDATAGFAVDGNYTGLSFRCGPAGGVAMIFSGFPGELQNGEIYTVAGSVDGTAFLFQATAREGEGAEPSRLVKESSLASLSGLIEALRKGRTVGISGPAGHYTVPLTGSGKALAVLRERCS